MRIAVNGETTDLPDSVGNVADLVTRLNLAEQQVAVEQNGSIIRRAEWTGTRLADGDVLEIVTLVGGG